MTKRLSGLRSALTLGNPRQPVGRHHFLLEGGQVIESMFKNVD
jgi:hypothetical protein